MEGKGYENNMIDVECSLFLIVLCEVLCVVFREDGCDEEWIVHCTDSVGTV